jgi:hypothetical protein
MNYSHSTDYVHRSHEQYSSYEKEIKQQDDQASNGLKSSENSFIKSQKESDSILSRFETSLVIKPNNKKR